MDRISRFVHSIYILVRGPADGPLTLSASVARRSGEWCTLLLRYLSTCVFIRMIRSVYHLNLDTSATCF